MYMQVTGQLELEEELSLYLVNFTVTTQSILHRDGLTSIHIINALFIIPVTLRASEADPHSLVPLALTVINNDGATEQLGQRQEDCSG
jgi:hypothetical protein